jgi:hypothetical protein
MTVADGAKTTRDVIAEIFVESVTRKSFEGALIRREEGRGV